MVKRTQDTHSNNYTKLRNKLKKLHFHEWISRKAYYLHGSGPCGEVKLCLKCGKIEKWGRFSGIPEDYKRLSKKLKASHNKDYEESDANAKGDEK